MARICGRGNLLGWGFGLLCLAFQSEALAQSQTRAPAPDPRHSQAKPGKKQPRSKAFVLVCAGDIASCRDPEGARATAKLIDKIPGTVFAAGDLAYENGSPDDFKNCYDPAWGRFKNRTKPAFGNHEYVESTPAGYFQYWGKLAGPGGKGYYSDDLGAWHIVVLNTNCSAKDLGGCGEGSPQET